MSSGFSLICNNCGKKVDFKMDDYMIGIRINNSDTINQRTILTCQSCGNSIKLRK